MNKKLRNLIFILVLGSISAGLLLGIRAYTLPKIERYQEIRLRSTILEAAGLAYDETSLDEVFAGKIRTKEKNGFTYYLSPADLYIFEFEGRGLWGMITGVVTLKPDLESVENIRIIAQEETPGLGGRIAEEGFLSQFHDKKVSPRLVVALRQKATADNEIDAISGASISSLALVGMINEAVIDFRRILEK